MNWLQWFFDFCLTSCKLSTENYSAALKANNFRYIYVFLQKGDFNGDGVSDLVSADVVSNSLGVFLGNSNDGVSALQSFSLKTQQDSRNSMSYLRKTLERVGQQRGHIGAFQSRVEVAANNLRQSSLAYSEANSRIVDIDVAEESASLTASTIIQQAASSVLAQANQQPQIMLQLLGGV